MAGDHWWNNGPLSWISGRQSGQPESRSQEWGRIGAAGGPAGYVVGRLAGWVADRRAAGRLQAMGQNNAANLGGYNDRLAQGINWGADRAPRDGIPMQQFTGYDGRSQDYAGFGAGVDPGAPYGGEAPDNIGEVLGISGYDTPGRAGGAGAGGPGGGEGYDLRASGSIMPTGSASMGYSAAGGGFGGGVWQGGGGTHVTYVNPPTGGGGIAKGKGKENGVNPN